MRGIDGTGFFHICTDGYSLPWMFKDKEDFIAGVNRVGICSHVAEVDVVGFILMDNHAHLVAYASMEKCKRFINLFKQLTGKWIRTKYGIEDYLKGLSVEIIPINSHESLLNTIAYIDRNSMVAGYRSVPMEYPWGTSRYMFRDCVNRVTENTKTISEFTVRDIRGILKTRVRLPDYWLVNSEGMIMPTSYIDISRLEKLFKSVNAYLFFLSKKLEGIVELEMENGRKTFTPDKELRPVAEKMAQEMFGCPIADLNVSSKINIARRLKSEYLASVKQVSRMVQLKEELLDGFI